MTRDGDADRAYHVTRAGVFIRLVDDQRVGLLAAEHWLQAWETKAEELGRPRSTVDFWDEGLRWITGELALERRASH